MRRTRRIRSLGAAIALSLTLGTVSVVATPSGAGAAAPKGSIAWGPCEGDLEGLPARLVCATLAVPVDWAKPHGATFDLALAKLPAAAPSRRIGALFVNPGGPGGSGVGLVYGAEDAFSPALIDRFDIVSFDPRGQAASHPVLCDSEDVAAQDNLLYPRSAAEYAALRKANKALGESCRELTGPLVGHVDTASVVRDMDAVRAGIGEQKISYYGVSYGTMIGQQYAELFPHRVRALALDSNMDHAQDIWSYQKWETLAMERSFQQFAAWCGRTETCVLHGQDVPAYFDHLYALAEAGDLVLDPGTEFEWVLRPQDLISITFSYMYNPGSWFSFAELLQQLGGDAPATAQARRGEPVELGYRPVMCQDFHFDVHAYQPVAAMEKALNRLAPHTRVNPLAWTDLTGCQNWPGRVTNPPHRLKASPQLPPILLTNSRYDIATPYEWGRSLASQLPSATFLTYDGVGHGDYWLSPCARDAIDTYLQTTRTPPQGTHCPAIFPSAEQNRRAAPGTLVNPLVKPMPAPVGPMAR
jgi:pimeloyl-ACP methyl ester carboxylesterase